MTSTEDTPVQLELYLAMLNLWSSEIDRFYGRQNLYSGLQLALFGGIYLSFSELKSYPSLLRFAFMLLITISILTTLIAFRGIRTQKQAVRVLTALEESNPNLNIIELATRFQRGGFFTNFWLSASIPLIFSLAWIVLWMLFESKII